MTTLSKNNITDLLLTERPNYDSFPDLRKKGKSMLAEKGVPAPKEEEYLRDKGRTYKAVQAEHVSSFPWRAALCIGLLRGDRISTPQGITFMRNGSLFGQKAAVVQGLGHELPKLVARVRFPAAAPHILVGQEIDFVQESHFAGTTPSGSRHKGDATIGLPHISRHFNSRCLVGRHKFPPRAWMQITENQE